MDAHSDHSEDESTAPGSSNGSVYLTPSVSGMDIDNKLTQSAFEVIESDEVSVVENKEMETEPESIKTDIEIVDSDMTDESVDSADLPDLVKIEDPEEGSKPAPKNTEINEESEPVHEWEDVLGTGRLHIKRITEGSGPKLARTSCVKIEIKVPTAAFDLRFGTNDCDLKFHSNLQVLLGDQIDPAPGAIELSLHGLSTGAEIAVRSHKDLKGNLPDEFQIRVLEILETDDLTRAEESKNLGNKCYKAADYQKAVRYYERAIGYVNEYSSENEPTDDAKDLWMKISKNLGRSFFKLGKNSPSLEKFDEILTLFPNDLDVLLLKVEVLSKESKLDDLLRTCKSILTMKIDAKTEEKIRNRIEKVKTAKKKQEEKYRIMCQRMTGNTPTKSENSAPAPVPAASTTGANDSNSLSHLLIGGAVLAVVASIVAFAVYRK